MSFCSFLGLLRGKQNECLNFVQNSNFSEKPFEGFSACSYSVHPTKCQNVVDKQQIEIGMTSFLPTIRPFESNLVQNSLRGHLKDLHLKVTRH